MSLLDVAIYVFLYGIIIVAAGTMIGFAVGLIFAIMTFTDKFGPVIALFGSLGLLWLFMTAVVYTFQ